MRLALALPAAALAALLAAAALAEGADRFSRLNVEETQLSAEQARNMSALARLLSVLEQLRRDPPPALLVSPHDARDAIRAAILVKAMTPELEHRARAYARAAGEMARERRLAAVESEALFTADSERAEAAPEAGGPPPALHASAATAGPATPPTALLVPVSGPVVRRFGATLSDGAASNGLTWAAPRAERVISPASGVVQYVGPVKGWGVILILKLTGGYHLVLAGLGQVTAAVGQSVAPGQPVGWMPDGRQSSSALYLELRDDGAPVDPGRWMQTERAER